MRTINPPHFEHSLGLRTIVLHSCRSDRIRAGVKPAQPAERAARNADPRSNRNLALDGRAPSFRQLDVSVPVDHRLEAVDLMIGASRRAIASSDQTENAERRVDRSPAIDNAAEEIARE
jgi:hypothetical protein